MKNHNIRAREADPSLVTNRSQATDHEAFVDTSDIDLSFSAFDRWYKKKLKSRLKETHLTWLNARADLRQLNTCHRRQLKTISSISRKCKRLKKSKSPTNKIRARFHQTETTMIIINLRIKQNEMVAASLMTRQDAYEAQQVEQMAQSDNATASIKLDEYIGNDYHARQSLFGHEYRCWQEDQIAQANHPATYR